MAVESNSAQFATAARRLSARPLSLDRAQVLAAAGLGLVVLLGAFLRFYQLGTYSIGNTYYAATVQSMLTSWHNFFFAAFEPGGSVTVDKPPLGFWVQAASAYVLGVNGFALALPQALAGVLSIPLLYALVKRHFGTGAGLLAGLALAVTPVAVSTERNNTIDGLLVFVLLLAAWAFLRATCSGRLRDLLLGVVLVGLGFNIKMLQAFMPLPAFYALYLLGAPQPWWKRIVHLGLASAVLLLVSLSWAIAVDLTPADSRPYIGSSTNNTVMELIVGHNGLRRLGLMGPSGKAAQPAPNSARPAQAPLPNTGQPGQFQPPNAGQPGQFPLPPHTGQPGQLQPPPQPGQLPARPPNAGQPGQLPAPLPGQLPPSNSGQGGGPLGQGGQPPQAPNAGQQPGNSQEVGQAGWLRLFGEPLVTEASWLLPLVLLGLPLVVIQLGWPWPLSDRHLALVLWAGWLLPELLYFSLNTGLFHAYYLIMLGPPLAAMAGLTGWAIWQTSARWRWPGWIVLGLASGGTLAFQIVMLRGTTLATPVAAVSGLALILGLGTLAVARGPARKMAVGLALLAVMIAPLLWSSLTTFNTNPDVWLPRSGSSSAGLQRPSTLTAQQHEILEYVSARTAADSYLLATLNAREAAPYILATLQPVLTFGGFSGSDDVVDVDQLASLVAGGELRFVLGGQELARQKPAIAAWLANRCSVVSIPGATPAQPPGQRAVGPDQPGPGSVLYDCGQQIGTGG